MLRPGRCPPPQAERRLQEVEERSEERAAAAHALEQVGKEREQELLALNRSYNAAAQRRRAL